ncbi:MAG TPA: Crp/Fnr family transcriptional regulator [Caldilineaceae bacterium]|nr:Crp/Fnr family transcriptional regulator [Caldilineaceae bacterium]
MLKEQEYQHLTEVYPSFRQLTPALQQLVRQNTQPVHVPTGTMLFDLDYPCNLFLLILDGAIRVVKPALSGREILLYRLEPGDSCILTVSCLLGQNDYPARGVVEQALVGYALPRPLFTQLLEESTPFRNFVFHFFGERMSHLMSLVEEVAFQQMDQRLAALLVERGPLLTITHQQLADELGSAREVMSRILKHFEGKGWVELARGQIHVTNATALSRYAENPV